MGSILQGVGVGYLCGRVPFHPSYLIGNVLEDTVDDMFVH